MKRAGHFLEDSEHPRAVSHSHRGHSDPEQVTQLAGPQGPLLRNEENHAFPGVTKWTMRREPPVRDCPGHIPTLCGGLSPLIIDTEGLSTL